MSLPPSDSEQPGSTHEALTQLLGTHPKVTILTALLEHPEGMTAATVYKNYPVSDNTVYKHIQDVREWPFVTVSNPDVTGKIMRLDKNHEFYTAIQTLVGAAEEAYND